MRILHLVAIPQLTGAAEPTLDMVRALRALGAHVDLGIDTRRTGNLRALIEESGERIMEDVVLSTKAGPVAALRDIARLRPRLTSYDVVHTHLSHDHAVAAVALGGRARPALVRTIHAERALRSGVGRRWLFQRTRGITVACAAHREALVRDHALDPTRILVLPGSVDTRRFHPDPEARARVRLQLGLEDQALAVGCVARFQTGRRHEVMLEAIAEARKRDAHVRLLLIGHGETEAALRARANAADLAGAVVFCGYHREDLNDWLAALDVALWLVPGNDATSRAVLQAMAVGLPVIGGAHGAIAEAVEPDSTGLLVDPEDPHALAEALLGLARDRARAKALGARARLRAEERFEPLARGRRILGLYEALLSEQRLALGTGAG